MIVRWIDRVRWIDVLIDQFSIIQIKIKYLEVKGKVVKRKQKDRTINM